MNTQTPLQISTVKNKHDRCSICTGNSEEAGELTLVTFGAVNFRLCGKCIGTVISVLELRRKER